MSAEMETVLLLDDRLRVHDTLKYAVKKGGSQITPYSFDANSASADSLVFNITVPSENTLIDREVLLEAVLNFELQLPVAGGTTQAAFNQAIQLAQKSALAPFPLHQLMNTAQVTINSNTVSLNMNDILPMILHMVRRKSMHRYSGTTPTALDNYAKYSNVQNNNNNPLGGFQNAVDNDWSPRGSFVMNYFSTTQNPAGANLFDVTLPAIPVNGTIVSIYGQVKIVEPLMVSPFIFGHPSTNSQGFYGVQNMTFQFNLNNGSRMFRSAYPTLPVNGNNVAPVCKFTGFGPTGNVIKPRAHFIFITPHSSLDKASRNIVAWYNMPRYITPYTPGGQTAIDRKGMKIVTDNLQLNQIPDKLIILVRPRQSDTTMSSADRYLTIKNVAIDFNNQSGILSNASQEQLYRMSIDSGVNMSWNEWSGKTNLVGANGAGQIVGTTGSILVLSFADQIALQEEFYSSGSLGNFNLRVTLTVDDDVNADGVDGPLPQAYEVVLCTLESGMFVCERGASSVYSGLLTKEVVIKTSLSKDIYTRGDANRMIGGGFLDGLSSVAGLLKKGLPKVAEIAGDPCAQSLAKMAVKKMSGKGKPKNTLEDKFY